MGLYIVLRSPVPASLVSFVGKTYTEILVQHFFSYQNAVEYCRTYNQHLKKFHPERYGKDFYFIHKK